MGLPLDKLPSWGQIYWDFFDGSTARTAYHRKTKNRRSRRRNK